MGLDGVELIMACEDAFRVSISDAEAAGIRTPSDMILSDPTSGRPAQRPRPGYVRILVEIGVRRTR